MERNVIPEHFDAPCENYPFPTPFVLSSVERDWCIRQANSGAAFVYIKRRHLEENLNTFSAQIGMDEMEKKKFLDWWCGASPGSATIRAEGDQYFDIRYRAESWMERRSANKNNNKSRVEKYAESARQFFGGQEVSSGTQQAPGFGYADIPDEQ